MRDTLRPGLEGTFRYRVSDSKTVPRIYEDAADFQLMPHAGSASARTRKARRRMECRGGI